MLGFKMYEVTYMLHDIDVDRFNPVEYSVGMFDDYAEAVKHLQNLKMEDDSIAFLKRIYTSTYNRLLMVRYE